MGKPEILLGAVVFCNSLFYSKEVAMEWADNLYVSNSAAGKKDKIIRKAERGVGMIQVYLITLASNEKNLLDIFHAAHLKQPAFYGQNLQVVGIACGMEEARELTLQMITDIYEQTGRFEVRNYFSFSGRGKRMRPKVFRAKG